MSEYAIIYPTFVMIALTAFVFARLGFMRVYAVKAGEIDGRFFKSYRGYDEPERLRVWSRHAINLTEMPVLFYIVVILIYVTGQSSMTLVALAWFFVLARVMHSLIHLGSNKIIHRFKIYAVSLAALLLLWVLLLIRLLTDT